ncbi:hypothetical protein EC973_001158 [Apophysomyces ossiformis]|uniref:Ricin B lectin domain-containing protein n=1 Tax=Apophysomyces ossiformis TaxID=679940 RepID=A0A8H7BPF8_9FUNG|nr:hypothetical protein EC973_001158 [Apophysomyces ossiformis]
MSMISLLVLPSFASPMDEQDISAVKETMPEIVSDTADVPHERVMQAIPSEFPSGWFYIKSYLGDLVVTVRDGSVNTGAQIDTWSNQRSGNQLWRYTNGFLINQRSNLALSLNNDSLDASTLIVQRAAGSPRNLKQQWGYDNGAIFSHAKTDFVLDVRGSSTTQGTDIILYQSTNNNNQKWALIPA